MSSSALPSASVVKAWNEGEGVALQAVLTWARVAGPLATALLNALDTTAEEPYKSLMLLSEAEAATIITKAMEETGNAIVEVRRIDAAKEIAGKLANSRNVVYLPNTSGDGSNGGGGANLLLGLDK